ncbi:hypothetical protein [Oligoflexus tunisiensis]|uniref:hypothetical protein n=1 Tax=Oligoflexus tunisiensis TaxID=708132 RepID=UPI00114CA478|nr:hypothetical protein [Oligoflexus tunisiensis]
MTRLTYLPIAILALTPVAGFAHKVPYGASHCANTEEQANAEEIPICTQEEKEEAAATAFCKFTGRPDLKNCVESIVKHGMAEAAGKCVDEAVQKQVDLREELVGHKIGGGGSATDGYWHVDYKYSKQEGLHRHDWSEGARDLAGRDAGTLAVRQAKESAAVNKTTTETATTTSAFGKFLTQVGLSGLSSVDVEAGADHSRSNGTTTEKGPLTDAQAKEAYAKAYKAAYDNPNLTKVNPDIMCEKDEPNCSSSFSRNIPNEDYTPQPKKPEEKPSSNANKSSSSSKGDDGNNNHKTPSSSPSKSDKTGEVKEHHNTYAGDPSPVTPPGEMLATYDHENFNNPVAKCLFESFMKEVSKDNDKTYNEDGFNKSAEERKKEAAALLKKGVCDTSFYGTAYCQKFRQDKLTTEHMQDPVDEDKSTLFDEIQDMGHIDFGNPKDDLDKTPIDFSKIKQLPTNPADPVNPLPFKPNR